MAKRKPSRINRPLIRILIIWIIQTLALILLSFLLPLTGQDINRIFYSPKSFYFLKNYTKNNSDIKIFNNYK